MDDKRPQDELSEQIDAVRPASDDLSHPDFARLAERSRRDAQIPQLQRTNVWIWPLATPCKICRYRPARLNGY